MVTGMLPSELARELGWEPSSMSKRRAAYHAELGTDVESVLSDRTITDLRAIRATLRERPGWTYRQALLLRLGKAAEPVPPESVQVILQRLTNMEESQLRLEENQLRIEEVQRRLLDKMDAIGGYLRDHFKRQGGVVDEASDPFPPSRRMNFTRPDKSS